MAARGWKWLLERLPSTWNHVIETESLKFKALKMSRKVADVLEKIIGQNKKIETNSDLSCGDPAT